MKQISLPQSHNPGLLCDECFANPGFTQGNDHVLTAYCSHFKCGGFISLRDGKPDSPWQLFFPVSHDEFLLYATQLKKFAEFTHQINSAIEAQTAEGSKGEVLN